MRPGQVLEYATFQRKFEIDYIYYSAIPHMQLYYVNLASIYHNIFID